MKSAGDTWTAGDMTDAWHQKTENTKGMNRQDLDIEIGENMRKGGADNG